MKKVIFTAIAMIAFSSASMANTIADEEVNVLKIESINIVKEDTCLDFAIAELEIVDPDNTLSGIDAHDYFQAMYDICSIGRSLLD